MLHPVLHAAAFLHEMMQNGMMQDGMMGGMWLGPILGLVVSLLLIAALVLLVIWLYQQVRDGGRSRHSSERGEPEALDVARRRYARGELTAEEFERLRRDLS